MTITEFKRFATLTHNNKENAGKAWGRGWGYGTSENERWAYKEYTLRQPLLSSLTFVYRSGRVLCRHGSYAKVTYSIDGNPVSRGEFIKALNIAMHGGYYECKVA